MQVSWASIPFAGFPYDVVANGHYVPGTDRNEMSRYRGKAVWTEILQITDSVCDTYFARVHKLFNDAVTPDFSNKMKAGRSYKTSKC